MENKKMTVGEISQGKDGFKLDFSKLNKSVNQCKIDKQNIECRRAMKDLGIEWVD